MYIDADMACRRGILGNVKVTINGTIVNKCLAAKDGKNGFVEYYLDKLNTQKDAIKTVKKRGNVKVSFNLHG